MRYVYSGDQDFTSTAYTVNANDILSITAGSRMTGDFYGAMIQAYSGYIQNSGSIVTNKAAGVSLVDGASLLNYGLISTTYSSDFDDSGSVRTSLSDQSNPNYRPGNTVINYGTIEAHGDSAYALKYDSAMTIVNYGVISSERRYAITGYGDTHFANFGTITGSLQLNSGDGDTVVNAGAINGDVFLGQKNDVFDTSLGTVSGKIVGGLGSDYLTGSAFSDTIFADTEYGIYDDGNDTVSGGRGSDTVYGGYGIDFLYGNQDNDTLYGNQGDDTLYGGKGNDRLYGGKDDDLLYGNLGDDTVSGNLGDDTFVFGAGFGHDVVTDFSRSNGNTDQIQFQAGTFSSFSDVQSHTTQSGADTVITLDAASSVTLTNVVASTLTADSFIFG